MKEKVQNIKFEKEVAIISTFLSVYILYWFFGAIDFSLAGFSKIYISQATLDGVDVAKRVKLFYSVVIGGFFIIPVFYFLLNRLRVFFHLRKKDLEAFSVIGTSGFFLILAELFGIESTKGISFFLIVFLILVISIGFGKSRSVFRLIGESSFYTAILTISFILLSGILFLFNSNSGVVESIIWYFGGIYFILTVIILFVKKITGLYTGRILQFLLPLTLIPLFTFISVESLFYFKDKFGFFIHFKWVFIGLLFLSFFLFGVYNFVKSIKISSRRLLLYFFIPSALLSFLVLTIYTPVIEQSHELFELANPANAQMRIFEFGEIPFVDFMSSHMFSEQFYGIIHNLIHGYDGSLGFLTYKFFYKLIFFFIAYYFLFKIFKKPVLAILFLVSFPFGNSLFSNHLFYGIVAFFAVRKVMEKQSLINYVLLLSAVILLIFWRLDTGSSALFATVVFLPVSFYVERKRVDLRMFLKSLALILFVILVAVFLFALIKSPEYLSANFKSAFHYASANQAHGFSSISKVYNQQFFLLHVIFPVIAVLSILFSIFTLRNKSYSNFLFNNFTLHSSLFLFLIYLANFQRGIIRHSFFVNQDSFLTSTFYIAFALFLLSFIKTNRSAWKYISFYSLSFLLIFAMKYFPLDKGKSNFEKYLTQSTLTDIDNYFNEHNYKGKVISDEKYAKEKYKDLKQFLDKNLTGNQTFLDFSNTPMLYYYCRRNVPSYFCQSLQNCVDDYLQLQHLERVSLQNVPVVIYSNYPPNWWDSTDGVPNVMRQYLIAEYIYRNYKPFGIINNHSIWVDKKEEYEWDIQKFDTLLTLPKFYDYKKAAPFINRYFMNRGKDEIVFLNEEKAVNLSEGDYAFFEIKPQIASSSSVFLKLVIDAPANGQEVKIEILSKGETIGTTLFDTVENENEYMIRLSNHYLWHNTIPQQIKISGKEWKNVTKIEFYKDIRNEH